MRLNRVCVIPDRGCACGVVGCNVSDTVMSGRVCCVVSGSGLGWPAGVGESPVREDHAPCVVVFPSSSGPVKSAVNLPGPPGKPKYSV